MIVKYRNLIKAIIKEHSRYGLPLELFDECYHYYITNYQDLVKHLEIIVDEYENNRTLRYNIVLKSKPKKVV